MNSIAQRHPEDNPGLGQLLPIFPRTIGTQEVNAVSARALHAQLGLNGTHWARWSKRNIEENEFATKGEDWIELDPESPLALSASERVESALAMRASTNPKNPMARPQQTKDFFLSIDFAKKLAMKAHTKEGEVVRDYFLACEQVAHRVVSGPMTFTPEMAQMVGSAMAAAMGIHPGWKQPLAEKVEQARRDAKGAYELVKGKVLPALERIESKPPACLGDVKPKDAIQLLNAIARTSASKRDAQEAASKWLPGLISPPPRRQGGEQGVLPLGEV